MMYLSSIVAGSLRYEFWMQLRRRSVWIVLALLVVLIFLLWQGFGNHYMYGHYAGDPHAPSRGWVPPLQSGAILMWAQIMAMFIPVGVGLLLADRVARDRQLHVDELFDTLLGPLGARLLGKFLGSVLATLVPIVLLYAIGIGYILTQVPGLPGISLAAEAFATILLPGMLFVAGFSLAVPVVLKVPIYQFLFTGYWFWANLMSPKIGLPSPVGTMINAAGPYASEGFFNFQWTFLILHATVAQGIESVALLVGLGLVGLIGGWGYLRWQQAQR